MSEFLTGFTLLLLFAGLVSIPFVAKYFANRRLTEDMDEKLSGFDYEKTDLWINDLVNNYDNFQSEELRERAEGICARIDLNESSSGSASLLSGSGICPKCKGALARRYGKYGYFYGCSNFPGCRFTKNI